MLYTASYSLPPPCPWMFCVMRVVCVHVQGAPTNNRAILQFTPVADAVAAAVVEIARGEGAYASLRVPTTHTVVIKYSWGPPPLGIPPVYVTGNPWRHACALLCAASHTVGVFRLPEGLDPQPADYAAGTNGSGGGSSSGTTTSSVASAAGTGSNNSSSGSSSSSGLTRRGVGSALGGAVAGKIAGLGTAAANSEAALPPASWSEAVREVMTQLLRGSRAVALGAADHAAYCAFYEQWRGGMK